MRVSGRELVAEGVTDVGAIHGTNVLYVITGARTVLFFADQVAGLGEGHKPRRCPASPAPRGSDSWHSARKMSRELGTTSAT